MVGSILKASRDLQNADVPKLFVSASEAQKYDSAHGCQLNTYCLKARFEKETFRLLACWKYLSDLVTLY